VGWEKFAIPRYTAQGSCGTLIGNHRYAIGPCQFPWPTVACYYWVNHAIGYCEMRRAICQRQMAAPRTYILAIKTKGK